MCVQKIQIAGFTCNLFLPRDYEKSDRHYPVIYINGDVQTEEIADEIRKAGSETAFLLLSIRPGNWNDDFTPWSAPAFRKGEEAPKGLADIYLAHVVKEIKPYIDANYRTKPEPEYTAMFGYSLGGLTAVYSIYRTDVFGAAGSLSGSLWYDGFCAFMEKGRPVRQGMKVYLSLGKKESASRNPRMCRVAECTERAKNTLAEQLRLSECHCGTAAEQTDRTDCADSARENPDDICFEWNEGGHFHEIPKRFARAVLWWQSHMPV